MTWMSIGASAVAVGALLSSLGHSLSVRSGNIELRGWQLAARLYSFVVRTSPYVNCKPTIVVIIHKQKRIVVVIQSNCKAWYDVLS